MTRGWPVAAAVVRRAQMRAALDHPARNFGLRLAGVIAPGFGPTARILRDAACLRRIGLMLGRPPVSGPLPHIADHVVDPVAVRRKRRYRRRALEAIGAEVLVWEVTLPGIGHVFAAGCELITPGVLGAIEPPARGKLPFGFSRQVLAGPFCIGQRIVERDVYDRMIVEHVDVAFRAIGPPPVGAR